MSKFNIEDNHFWRGLLSRTLLVLVTVAIIVWFLPRNSGPQFRYDVGKPWMYGSFITKFDFPIYKTDEAIKAERDSLADEFEPYYAYAADVEKEKIDEFMSDFKNGIPGLSYDYVRIIADRLHRIYQAGIMAAPEYSEINKDSTNMVRIISGKQASSLMINCIYSTIGAYEQLLNDEKLAPQRAVLQKCNLNNYITPNLIYDKERSETEMNDLMAGIPLASGMVLSGQKIIDRGEIVDDYAFRVLNSFEKEMQRRSANSSEITSTILGQTLFVAILIILFTLYLVLYRKEYFQKPRNTTMLYVLITLFPILVSLMMKHAFLSVYILPFALVPIFVRVFMDARTAFISLVTMVLLCAAAVKYQYEFIIIQITSGLVAIYSLGELSQRAQLFRTAVLVTLTSAAVYLALQLMQDNSIFTMDHSIYIYFIMNGVLLLFAYPLMYLIEKAFGFISNVTLIELSNTSKDPLRKLSETAPGTFQHSIMVSNLAAQIANKIGANTQLVRTGALYHDIGKMEDPAYFTENQVGVNPLEKLPRPEAAQMVINHVTEGLKLGEKYDLPRIITDFIMTHHGEGKTKYVKMIAKLSPVVKEFETYRETIAEKLMSEHENFKENLQDAQVYEAYQQDNTKDKPKMTDKQYKEFTKVVEKYNKDCFAAIKEEMDKEVEVKYDKLTSDEFVGFCDSNDFTTTQALALSEVMSNID